MKRHRDETDNEFEEPDVEEDLTPRNWCSKCLREAPSIKGYLAM